MFVYNNSSSILEVSKFNKYDRVRVYNTPHAIIISKPKIASRTLDVHYERYLQETLKLPTNKWQLNKEGQKHIQEGTNLGQYLNEVFHDLFLGLSEVQLVKGNVPFKGNTPILDSNQLKFLYNRFEKKDADSILNQLKKIKADTYQSIKRVIGGNEKNKKIVIFYRDPLERITTGTIQDFFSFLSGSLGNHEPRFWMKATIRQWIDNDPNSVPSTFDISFSNTSFTKKDLENILIKDIEETFKYGLLSFNTIKDDAGRFVFKLNDKQFLSNRSALVHFVKYIFPLWLESENKAFPTHCKPYMQWFNEVVNANKDSSMELINIDQGKNLNLIDYLDNLYGFEAGTGNYDQTNSNFNWKSILGKLVKQSKVYGELIDNERTYYDLIESNTELVQILLEKK